MSEKKIIACWISEKKRQKLNWSKFHKVCEKEGFLLKMIDIKRDLEPQGPFCVFLHKLTDTLAHAEYGDQNAADVVTRVQSYIQKHPELIVIDPLENIKHLRERHKTYRLLHNGMQCNDVFTPNFIEINTKNVPEIVKLLDQGNVKFPFLCKPSLAQGSSIAHKMMIIFNKEGLKDCQPPCVAQDFINHNAILYKIFIVDEYFHVAERPSLKNFYQKDCESLNTVFFSSHDTCKSDSNSELSVIANEDLHLRIRPDIEVFEKIVKRIRKIFGLILVGVDVVIENHTGRYAIIDVNVFPGYDGYPYLFEHLLDVMKKLMSQRRSFKQNCTCKSSNLKKCLSDDLDSGFESDEKKKQAAV